MITIIALAASCAFMVQKKALLTFSRNGRYFHLGGIGKYLIAQTLAIFFPPAAFAFCKIPDREKSDFAVNLVLLCCYPLALLHASTYIWECYFLRKRMCCPTFFKQTHGLPHFRRQKAAERSTSSAPHPLNIRSMTTLERCQTLGDLPSPPARPSIPPILAQHSANDRAQNRLHRLDHSAPDATRSTPEHHILLQTIEEGKACRTSDFTGDRSEWGPVEPAKPQTIQVHPAMDSEPDKLVVINNRLYGYVGTLDANQDIIFGDENLKVTTATESKKQPDPPKFSSFLELPPPIHQSPSTRVSGVSDLRRRSLNTDASSLFSQRSSNPRSHHDGSTRARFPPEQKLSTTRSDDVSIAHSGYLKDSTHKKLHQTHRSKCHLCCKCRECYTRYTRHCQESGHSKDHEHHECDLSHSQVMHHQENHHPYECVCNACTGGLGIPDGWGEHVADCLCDICQPPSQKRGASWLTTFLYGKSDENVIAEAPDVAHDGNLHGGSAYGGSIQGGSVYGRSTRSIRSSNRGYGPGHSGFGGVGM
ncbi:hypothetical protein GQ43DRAFT_489496 [Delitschia confertaspora ATCC 74209]|uniref:Uncharacterized protein n=1 Tax=Delitschia confertaspora ATCC 74209 TaxID=1513339 RepID=A0A9P4MWF2_9PLEO|nr:hypothetical protein GQ43DRAFT_489496 [Delitschia confertaspora ATCC 74209]